ncbi:MAG: DUF4384 domain-containing protein [Hyphomicrobiaceae bacterium]
MSCHSLRPTRGRSRPPSLRTALFALALVIADALILFARADEALNARARAVLTTHCTPCRAAIGGATLDLAALARDPTLIRPGNPDGSPAYTELLRRFGGDPAGPSPDELATLRAWIEALPADAATCPTATFVPRERIEAELARLAANMKKPVSAYRILSFAHLDLGCATRAQLAEWREMIGLLLAAVAGVPHAVTTHILNAQDHHIAIDIQDLGWDAFRWRAILGVKTQIRRIPGPLIVRADQLVAQVLRGTFGTANAGPNGPVPAHLADSHLMLDNDRETARAILAPVAPPEKLERHAELILQLARQHLAPVNVHRVAAELGMSSAALVSVLEPAASGERHLLRRLIYGTVLRNDLEDAWALIARLLRVLPPERAVPLVPLDAVRPPVSATTPIDLTLYPDLPRYATGNAIEITVRSNVDCYLTVISIDREGYGTVIFPNDFAPGNRIPAHLSVTIPPQGARYRLRVKDKGRERIVALCTRMEGLVDGIRHDFERQRFQELGPYAAFLDAHLRRPPPVAEGEQKEDAPPPGQAHVPQSQIWRTGIVIEVQ